MHVGGEATAGGRPVGIEVETEPQAGLGPLGLEMLGRHHDDDGEVLARQALAGRGQRKGGLAGARAGDGEERRGSRVCESGQRFTLPRPERDAAAHGAGVGSGARSAAAAVNGVTGMARLPRAMMPTAARITAPPSTTLALI